MQTYSTKSTQRGASLLITLVILSSALLSILALSTTAHNNNAITSVRQKLLSSHEVANSASLIALTALKNLPNKNSNFSSWYFNSAITPTPQLWSSAPSIPVSIGSTSNLKAKYIVARQCNPSLSSHTLSSDCLATLVSSSTTENSLQSASTSNEPLSNGTDTSYIAYILVYDAKNFNQEYSFQINPFQ